MGKIRKRKVWRKRKSELVRSGLYLCSHNALSSKFASFSSLQCAPGTNWAEIPLRNTVISKPLQGANIFFSKSSWRYPGIFSSGLIYTGYLWLCFCVLTSFRRGLCVSCNSQVRWPSLLDARAAFWRHHGSQAYTDEVSLASVFLS